MPIFMLISGYFFLNTLNKYRGKWRDFSINQFKNIIYPIIVWGTISGVYIISNSGIDKFSLGGIIGWYKSFWFLIALIVCSVIVFFIEHIDRGKLKALAYTIIFVILCFLPAGDSIPFMFPYFFSGFLINKFKEKLILKRNIIKIGGIISAVLYVFFMYFAFSKEAYIYISGVNPIISQYGFGMQTVYNLIRWMAGFLGSYGIATVIFLAQKKLFIVGKCFSELGKISLQVYVVQHILLEMMFREIYIIICENLGYNVLQSNMMIFNFVYSVLIAIVFSFIIWGFTYILNKLNINKLIFGR